MCWRKRKQERKVQTVVRNRLKQVLGRVQAACVGFMQRKEQQWSPRQKKMYCLAFCVVAGGASLWVLADTVFFQQQPAATALEITAIERPMKPAPAPETRWTKEDTLAIQQFRHWIDSLSATEEGSRQLDSCWQQRPGLKDSFRIMEAIINNKNK